LFSSKIGIYRGAFSEISQPLLLMGMKTPISMMVQPLVRIRATRLFPAQQSNRRTMIEAA
jgi:hypothetical protein